MLVCDRFIYTLEYFITGEEHEDADEDGKDGLKFPVPVRVAIIRRIRGQVDADQADDIRYPIKQ
jgi:hypothetical protein